MRVIWPYLRPEIAIPTDDEFRIRGYDLLLELRDELKKVNETNEVRLKKVVNEDTPSRSPFELKDATVSYLSILEEFPCEFDDWEEQTRDDIWATRILKIWFNI